MVRARAFCGGDPWLVYVHAIPGLKNETWVTLRSRLSEVLRYGPPAWRPSLRMTNLQMKLLVSHPFVKNANGWGTEHLWL